jgi:hypothetical protein
MLPLRKFASQRESFYRLQDDDKDDNNDKQTLESANT